MNAERIIKKYSNRRLFDPSENRYVTLVDVRRLVLKGERFSVIDNHGVDITRQTLLQVVTEHEESLDSVLSRRFLADLILHAAGPARAKLGVYLEECLQRFEPH